MSTVFLLVVVLGLIAMAGPVVAGLYLFSRLKQRDPGTSGGLSAAVIIGGVAALVLLPALVFGVFGLAAFSSGPTTTEVPVPAEAPVPTAFPSAAPGVVPQVVGLPVEQARSALASAGLTVSEFGEGSLTAPAGQVVGQNPVAGTNVARGSTVSLAVSMGAY